MMVTHRLASVAFVDRLTGIDRGQVIEQGEREELLAQAVRYHRLWQMQSGFVISCDGHRAELRGERFQAIALFRDVAIAALDKLAEHFVSEFFQPGQDIYAEGEAGDQFFIVVLGTVSVSRRDAGGNSIIQVWLTPVYGRP
jgi:hypothetical protein